MFASTPPVQTTITPKTLRAALDGRPEPDSHASERLPINRSLEPVPRQEIDGTMNAKRLTGRAGALGKQNASENRRSPRRRGFIFERLIKGIYDGGMSMRIGERYG